jgi:hypothetical protein
MGKNFDVDRQGNEFVVTATDGHMHRVVQSEWQDAVCEFSDTVAAFYQNSSPKHPTDVEDEKGFRAFWREWTRRRTLAENNCLKPSPHTGRISNFYLERACRDALIRTVPHTRGVRVRSNWASGCWSGGTGDARDSKSDRRVSADAKYFFLCYGIGSGSNAQKRPFQPRTT